MSTPLPRSRLSSWLALSLLLVACAGTRQAERPAPARSAARSVPPPAAARPDGLYAADEALRDALSGPLEHVGTGPWPGIQRMSACAFRNARVLIVSAYCTITDIQAVRVDVFSPQRGRVRIYAESNGMVSARARRDYFTFTAESEPAPAPSTRLPPVSLMMSFAELRAYDEQRYGAYLPACFGGVELSQKKGGCLGPLAPRAGEWADRNRVFLEQASADWYRLVREMRALATRYGRDPDEP